MNILITGGTGFIGSNLLQKLIDENKHSIVLLTRKTTNPEKYTNFQEQGITVKKIDILNANEISNVFQVSKFDVVFHLAAIRGTGFGKREDYIKSNVDYTEILAKETLKQKGKFIFCSSIGVFGTIPIELPATEKTQKVAENDYYDSKILAEEKLNQLKSKGLNYVIIRPSVTYGPNDFGFPYLLISLVDKGIFPICKNTKIHLVEVNYLVNAFINAACSEIPNGMAFNVADKKPIQIEELVNFISKNLKNRDYPKWKCIPKIFFDFGGSIAKILQNKKWKTRFEFFSRDWYYDANLIQEVLEIDAKDTLPSFKSTINWYLEIKN